MVTMVTRCTVTLFQLPVVEMSWGENLRKNLMFWQTFISWSISSDALVAWSPHVNRYTGYLSQLHSSTANILSAICHLPSVIRHPSYAIRHVSCVIGNWSSAICHLLSAICHLLTIYLFSTHLCSIWSELDSEDLHLVWIEIDAVNKLTKSDIWTQFFLSQNVLIIKNLWQIRLFDCLSPSYPHILGPIPSLAAERGHHASPRDSKITWPPFMSQTAWLVQLEAVW